MKRKRNTEDKNRKQKNPGENPFLKLHTAAFPDTVNSKQDAILSRILAFSEASRQKSQSHQESNDFIENTTFLLEYLEHKKAAAAHSSTSVGALLSTVDVATMMLQWAVKSLVHASNQVKSKNSTSDEYLLLYWKTLRTCLGVLLSLNGLAGHDVAMSLSQSNLNKLMPFALQSALGSNKAMDTAVCFCLLAYHLYRPTMDSACHSLLPVVDNFLSRTASFEDCRLILPTKHHEQVLESMVLLLKHQQSTSNPRKVFQLLAEPNVLSALSRWRLAICGDSIRGASNIAGLVRELLSEGLFNPVYHIDGFRGMNVAVPVTTESGETQTEKQDHKQKSFHCYQETLLESLASLIGQTLMNDCGSVAAVLLVPEVLEGFIAMFASWERDSAAKLKKKGGRDIAPIQFRLWSNLVYPVVLKLRKLILESSDDEQSLQTSSDTVVVLLQSLRVTLASVLKHNLYLPSHKDENGVSFSFLQTLAVTFLDILDTLRGSDGKSTKNARIESECLQGLETLLGLNHLLLHERLDRLIAACGNISSRHSLDEYALAEVHQEALIISIIRTYLRLRQLDHLFRSLLKALITLQGVISNIGESDFNEKDASLSLKCLLLESKVRVEFAEAIAKCPPNQMRDLFEMICEWIQEHSKPTDDDVTETFGIFLAVSLFVLLIQNVRVDKHTSAEVAALCDDAIKKAVYPLIKRPQKCHMVETSFDQELKKEGLTLTGHLIDLKNRCAFWNDGPEPSGDEKNLDTVAAVLEDSNLSKILAVEGVMMESSVGSLSPQIQFLLLHRIRELHTDIYKRQLAGWTDKVKKTDKESVLLEEARQMVDNVVKIGRRQSASSASGWQPLAETVSYWAPFAETCHVESFLSWLFAILSMPEHQDDESQSVAEDRSIVRALLRDASFFEIPEVARAFYRVGLRCVMDLLRCSATKKSSIVFNELDLSNDLSLYSLEQLGSAMSAMTTSRMKKLLKGMTIRKDLLSQATRILHLMNGVPLPQVGLSCNLLIQLDVLICAVCLKADVSEETTVVPLLCSSRVLLAAWMSIHPDTIDFCGLDSLIKGMIDTTTRMMKLISNEAEMTQFLRASESVFESIASSCLAVLQQRPDPLNSLVRFFQDMLKSRNDVKDVGGRVLLNMTRSLVKRLIAHFQRHVLHESWQSIISPLIVSVRQSIEPPDKCSLQNEYFQAEWLLLVGDIARLSSLIESTATYGVDLCIVEESLKSSNEVVRRAAIYNLACAVSSGRVSAPTCDLVVRESLLQSNPLLDAAFCELVRGMNVDDIRPLLGQLLAEAQSPTDRKPHSLRLFQLVLKPAQGEAVRTEIAKSARAFFALSLELATPFDGTDLSTWVNECNLGISVIITLTENKDIIAIHSQDLSLILVQVASILGEGGTFRNPDVAPVDGRVYFSCFMLVSSLLQRFPKQLYACAPTVILTIHVLMRHALYGAFSDQDIAKRAQAFTRLSELLIAHRDVYKKHVLVLILEYVGALRSGIHGFRSKCMVPAVYCLLDMLSQFETEQLNTMMDNTSKALFRSIYQGHRKTHTYKGQY